MCRKSSMKNLEDHFKIIISESYIRINPKFYVFVVQNALERTVYRDRFVSMIEEFPEWFRLPFRVKKGDSIEFDDGSIVRFVTESFHLKGLTLHHVAFVNMRRDEIFNPTTEVYEING